MERICAYDAKKFELSRDSVLYKGFLCFASEQLKSSPSVRGSLRANIGFWRAINSDSGTLNIIAHGYQLPFVQEPPSIHLGNNNSAVDNADFVGTEISNLLAKECIQEVNSVPYFVSPLTVAIQSSGKKRLILDLSLLNCYMAYFKFKLEDI